MGRGITLDMSSYEKAMTGSKRGWCMIFKVHDVRCAPDRLL